MNDGYSDWSSSDPGYKSFPVKTEILVLPADEPKQLKLGWKVTESLGIAIVNPRGVAGYSPSPKRISIVK